MRTNPLYNSIICVTALVVLFCGCSSVQKQTTNPDLEKYAVHDLERPRPEIIQPGDRVTVPPSDAIVLFDGNDLSQWQMADGTVAKWSIKNNYMEVVKKTGTLRTKRAFGDCQLHIEWTSPTVIKGESQGRGNSGVFLMGIYEVQILDSYDNESYADGQAAAVYGQYPPLVNACHAPGKWQRYDIIFKGPRFEADETLIKPATITVLHNGVLVQDHVELTGPTGHKSRPPYKFHPLKLPLTLQDHGNPVRFRNIWIRELN